MLPLSRALFQPRRALPYGLNDPPLAASNSYRLNFRSPAWVDVSVWSNLESGSVWRKWGGFIDGGRAFNNLRINRIAERNNDHISRMIRRVEKQNSWFLKINNYGKYVTHLACRIVFKMTPFLTNQKPIEKARTQRSVGSLIRFIDIVDNFNPTVIISYRIFEEWIINVYLLNQI